jgi:hypothetical protein
MEKAVCSGDLKKAEAGVSPAGVSAGTRCTGAISGGTQAKITVESNANAHPMNLIGLPHRPQPAAPTQRCFRQGMGPPPKVAVLETRQQDAIVFNDDFRIDWRRVCSGT